VLDDTIVDRVVFDSTGHATGVVAGKRTIHGGCVVLAAGAYGSPTILMRSGVGPEDELRRHGIRPIRVLPAVGAGLADHCRAGVGFELRPEAAEAMRSEAGERTIVAQAIAKWASSRADPGTWDVHLLVIVPPDRATGRITTGLLAPRSRGRVRLAARDPGRLPLVEPCFLSDGQGHDLAALTEGIEFARGLARTRALSKLVTREVDPSPAIDSAEHARATVTSYYHPTGTCALGQVVDASGAVLGLEGLHVGDASIVPSPVRAGTHLTVLAVAERVAELMRGV
jgi:choline dehydrogenase